MKRSFTISVSQEGEWYVAQWMQVDVASQARQKMRLLRTCATLSNFTSHRQSPRITALIPEG